MVFKIPKKHTLILLIVGIELGAIYFITHLLFRQHISLNKLDSKVIRQAPTNKYIHFYEIESDIVKVDKPDWLSKEVRYYHNGDGLNSVRDYDLEKGDNTIRIAALGDSFTYALYTDTKTNWVSLLEKKLNLQECYNNTFEVLNFGVPGYDIDYTIERSKIRAEKYNPDLFIWFIKNDDFSDSKELSTPIEEKLFGNEKHTTDLYRKALDVLFKTHDKTQIINEQARHLEQYIQDNQSKKFLFVLPRGKIGYPIIEDKEIGIISDLKKKYRNVDFVFIEMGWKHTFFPNDYHLNEEGNTLFSDTLTQILTKRYCL